MITLNNQTYTTYYELCKHNIIDYKTFISYKKNNPDISELELLGKFIPNLCYRVSDNTYFTK